MEKNIIVVAMSVKIPDLMVTTKEESDLKVML